MITLNEQFLLNMKELLGDEYNDFLLSLEQESEKSLFVNSNKIDVKTFLNCVDFNLKAIQYEPCGFYVDNLKLGRHPLHHAGAFYLQEPSAMFTINAHNFNGDELVLDMCAAPGGKSIQIANRIPNGCLISNEINKKRSEILYSNIERMGLRNVIITNDSPENVANAYANTFDVVLVDAPCSGEGMFRKGEDIINNWNPNLNEICATRQLEILEHANVALKQGGTLIYSTCTYSKLENEDVVLAFMQNHKYQIMEINHNFNKGIDMPNAARLYPHNVKGEGQFVVVLKKLEENNEVPAANLKINAHKATEEFLNKECGLNIKAYQFKNFSYYVPNVNMIKRNVNYVGIGVRLCDISTKIIIPHHNLFTAFGNDFKLKMNLKVKDERVAKYLHGDTLDVNLSECYGALLIEGCAVGGFKISKGKFKNYYPKGLRNF